MELNEGDEIQGDERNLDSPDSMRVLLYIISDCKQASELSRDLYIYLYKAARRDRSASASAVGGRVPYLTLSISSEWALGRIAVTTF